MEDELLITGQGGRRDGRRRLDGRRVSHLKHKDILALMHDHRVAVHQSECQDRPQITPGNIGSGIVVVSIHVVDIPGERGDLKNPCTGRGSHVSKSQWTGSIRIHFFFQGGVFVTAIQMMSARMVMQ